MLRLIIGGAGHSRLSSLSLVGVRIEEVIRDLDFHISKLKIFLICVYVFFLDLFDEWDDFAILLLEQVDTSHAI